MREKRKRRKKKKKKKTNFLFILFFFFLKKKKYAGSGYKWAEKPVHRYYKGAARSTLGRGWARMTLWGSVGDVMTFTGAFMLDNELYEVKTPKEFLQMKLPVRPSCLLYSRGLC